MEHFEWESLAVPDQTDVADIHFQGEGLHARGVQMTTAYRAEWLLEAPKNWITSHFEITVKGHTGWSRQLSLTRSDSGVWTEEIGVEGTQPADLAAPGIVPGTDLSSALDIDLGRCPMTNTMPIRRLRLLERDVPRTPLVMAWIGMPSLRVIASDQYYSSRDDTSVNYESGTRNVKTVLEVDGLGLVRHYPDLARRLK